MPRCKNLGKGGRDNPGRPTRPEMDRFWEKVDKDGPVHPVLGTACWGWKGPFFAGKPYGQFKTRERCVVRAHKFIYELSCGRIPEGQVVRHKCDRGGCVNPDHLETGTHAQNIKDRDERGRTYRVYRQLTMADVKWIVVNYVPRTKSNGIEGLARKLGVPPSYVRRVVREIISAGKFYRDVKAGDLISAA